MPLPNTQPFCPLYILGVRVDDVSVEQALERVEKVLVQENVLVQVSNLNQQFYNRQFYITTPNPEICLYATEDEHYRRDILDEAFLALPDGFGLKIAARIFGERLQNRVTGVDFTYALMEQAAQNGWRVFLFGGGEGIAQKCKEVLEEKYKGLQIVGIKEGKIFNFQFSIFNKFSKDQSSPHLYEWGDQVGVLLDKIKNHNKELVQVSNLNQQLVSNLNQHNKHILDAINEAKPDILLVALGAPIQEYWISENLSKLPSVKLAVAVGGTFDFIAGKVRRAPKIMRSIGLEWLFRLIIQPQRFPRIFNATLKFLFTVLLWRVRMRFIYRRNVVGLVVQQRVETQKFASLQETVGCTRQNFDEQNLGGCSSVVECLLPKQKIAGSSPVTRSNTPLLTKEGLGEVLLVDRFDEPGHWQLPQGGIDKGETAQTAIWREMKEEIGTDKLKIIKNIPNFYRYLWPKIDQLRRGYRGQKQDLFILEFTGEDKDIQIDKREHCNFKWTPLGEAERTAHEIRSEQIKKAIQLYCNHI